METLEEAKIEKAIKIFRGAYGGLLGLSVFALCWMLLSGFKAEQIPRVAVNTLVFGTIYYGLSKLRPWVVNVVVILSTYLCFNYFLKVVGTDNQGPNTAGKFVSILMFIFFGYQLGYFANGKVRKYFKTNGSSLF